jgi:cysteine-rich repeat protein
VLGGDSDIDCGGPDCVKCGDGYQCGSGGDCLNGVCGNGFCLEASCTDNVKNGSETDVDCGGTCDVCAILEACSAPADCVSGICSNGTCAAPTCSDMVKNGAESDVDCGGGACPFCPDSLGCVSSTDCGSGVCTNNVCAPTVCGDSIKGAAEQCDDGNALSGDCCSSTCSLEANCEVEVNDNPGKGLVSATFPQTGLIKARIMPIGDIDYLAISVTSVVDLKLETFQGFTVGSCASIDTQMQLLAANGQTQLAYDDDGGLGFCSLIDPATYAGARQLAPGTYFVRINEYGNNGTIPAYSVQLTATATCGNGIKEGYEQCDDGNQNNNDNCSSICKIITTPEVEPNNTCLTASGPIAAAVGGSPFVSGSVSPIGDNDWFAFTVPATADVIFETFDANGPGTCVSTDTEIQVFKADCVTPLGAAQNVGGLGSCAKLSPIPDAQVRHIPAGTYYVRVNEYQNNALIAGYTLQATITALCGNGVKEGFEECDGGATCDANCDRIPTCGDGGVDAPEVCDDGNVTGGDGCDATCSAVELNYQCPSNGGPCVTPCGDAMTLGTEQCDDGNVMNGDGCDSACATEVPPVLEVEPNGNFADAEARASDPTPILISGVSTTVAGSITPLADQDVYKVVLAADSVVRAEIFDATGNNCPAGMTTTLSLFGAAQTLLVSDTTSGIASCSALTGFLPAGTYYVRVEETGNNALIAAYRLQIKVQKSVGSESELNDATVLADPLGGPSDVFIFGNHQQNLDADLYSVFVPAGRSIRAEIIEGSAAETCESNGIDSRLTLVSPAGVDLVSDDDAGRGYCSLIDGTGTTPLHAAAKNLAGGMYFINVRASTTSSAQTGPGGQFDYRLVVTVR